MPFSLVRNDIVKMPTDAIVNAANSGLAPGGGVCGAIFDAAGYTLLARACRRLGGCPTGEAVATEGFRLPAKYIIHAVGPVWQGGGCGEAEKLRSCYLRSLELARELGCQSIAFPLISSGIYGYPKREALDIAISAIRDFLRDEDMDVYLVLFDRSAVDLVRYEELLSYIDDHYVEASPYLRRAQENRGASFHLPWSQPKSRERREADGPMGAPSPPVEESASFSGPAGPLSAPAAPGRRSLEEVVEHLDESFSKMLFRLIDQRGLTDVQVYKRANLDRRLFSKLRRESCQPGKQTVLALCIALELSLDETRDLLARAGYALSPCSKFDVIIEYYIRRGSYDIFEINEALFAFDQKLLGA